MKVDYCTQKYLDQKYPGMNKTCKSKEEANEIIDNDQRFALLKDIS
jgi:hypothetical protein